MLDKILQYIAPHYCFGCNNIGKILCSNCKHDIIEESSENCILCSRPAVDGVCSMCRGQAFYSRAWYVGEREDSLRKVIDGYKFKRQQASAQVLAQLLHERLPILPHHIIVVKIPTIHKHIRQRGFDHSLLLAQEFAKRRHLPFSAYILQRRTQNTQRGQSRRMRQEQATRAFKIGEKIDKDKIYLIIDDVLTTGATLKNAAQLLKKEGAADVYIAVVARQPLD